MPRVQRRRVAGTDARSSKRANSRSPCRDVVSLAGRVSAPVLRLAQIWQDFHQARLSVLRLGDILNTAAEPTYSAARARLPAIRGNITFDHDQFPSTN